MHEQLEVALALKSASRRRSRAHTCPRFLQKSAATAANDDAHHPLNSSFVIRSSKSAGAAAAAGCRGGRCCACCWRRACLQERERVRERRGAIACGAGCVGAKTRASAGSTPGATRSNATHLKKRPVAQAAGELHGFLVSRGAATGIARARDGGAADARGLHALRACERRHHRRRQKDCAARRVAACALDRTHIRWRTLEECLGIQNADSRRAEKADSNPAAAHPFPSHSSRLQQQPEKWPARAPLKLLEKQRNTQRGQWCWAC